MLNKETKKKKGSMIYENVFRNKTSFATLEMRKKTLAELPLAKTSGIITRDVLVSYWPIMFSLSPVIVPEVFAKVNSNWCPSSF